MTTTHILKCTIFMAIMVVMVIDRIRSWDIYDDIDPSLHQIEVCKSHGNQDYDD